MKFRLYVAIAAVMVVGLLGAVVSAAPPAGYPSTLPSVHFYVPSGSGGGGPLWWDTGVLTWADDNNGYVSADGNSSMWEGDYSSGQAGLWNINSAAPDPNGLVDGQFNVTGAVSDPNSWGPVSIVFAADSDGNNVDPSAYSGIALSGGNFPVGEGVPEVASGLSILPVSGLLLRRRSRRTSTGLSGFPSASSASSSELRF